MISSQVTLSVQRLTVFACLQFRHLKAAKQSKNDQANNCYHELVGLFFLSSVLTWFCSLKLLNGFNKEDTVPKNKKQAFVTQVLDYLSQKQP